MLRAHFVLHGLCAHRLYASLWKKKKINVCQAMHGLHAWLRAQGLKSPLSLLLLNCTAQGLPFLLLGKSVYNFRLLNRLIEPKTETAM